MKDEFVANVSHELRTPISNLKLRQFLIDKQPEQANQHRAVLRRETERLEELIEALLTLSRLDQHRTQASLSPLNLNHLVEEYLIDRASLAESKGLSLHFELLPDLPLVSGDRFLLGQALSILLTNAFNYTPKGGQVAVKTECCTLDDLLRAGISIRDTGLGILAEEQPQIFTRFFRGSAGYTSGVQGTGLGLAIAKEIVDLHQGRITVASEGIPGQGTVFTIWLPAHPSQSVS